MREGTKMDGDTKVLITQICIGALIAGLIAVAIWRSIKGKDDGGNGF